MRSPSASPLVAALVLTAAALCGALLVLRASSEGLDFSPDSVSYFAMAEGLADGEGFSDARRYWQPALPTYPPGYSLLMTISSLGSKGETLMAAIRWTHSGLLAVAVFGLGWIVFGGSGSCSSALAAAALFLASDMVTLYATVWSEVPMITFTVLFLLQLSRFLDSQRWRDLVLTACCAGLCALFRYPGVVVIGAGLVAVATTSSSWRAKSRHLAAYTAISTIPLALWLLRNIAVFGRPYLGRDRGPSGFAFSQKNMELGVDTLSRWSGEPTGFYLLLAAVLFAGTALLGDASAGTKRSQRNVILPSFVLMLAYVLVMSAGTFLFGLHKPLNYRTLGPLLPPALCLLFLGGLHIVRLVVPSWAKGSGWPSWLAQALRATVLVVLVATAARSAYSASAPGKIVGMLQRPPRAVVEAFKEIEPFGTVFSNIDDTLYLLTGQQTLRLPQIYSLDSREVRVPDYDEKIQQFRAQLESGGMIVYYTPSRRHYLPSVEELEDMLRLEAVQQTDDGTIYRVLGPR